MTYKDLYKPASNIIKNSHANEKIYEKMYSDSINSPEEFWKQHGQRIDWIRPYTKVKDVSYKKEDLRIKWYQDGTLNASFNCLDRHLKTKGENTAIIWEGDNPNESKHISYNELYKDVCKFSNVLKDAGAKKGDRVTIYMPMIPEATIAMLACTRIGAIHSVVFGGFSPDALAGRIEDCDSSIIITADEGIRGGKPIPLKSNTDEAISKAKMCKTTIVVKRTGADINWINGQDIWYHEEMEKASPDCPPTEMNAEDPMFILYTSGSTGKPKGVLHTTGGYMVYASMTHHYVFDYQENEIYWCTADVGWVTGHSYIVYGPLANGATTLMFEGVPNYPTVSRFWEIVDKHQVNIFYTAPTAIRALTKASDINKETHPTNFNLSSLRILGTVGEPINPEAWMWYYENVGNNQCPIVDTFWQTETGGHVITPLPGATPLIPGSCTLPFPGIDIDVVDENGGDLQWGNGGLLVIKKPWPSMIRNIWGDPDRFKKSYFPQELGGKHYLAGDGAVRDEKSGYFTIMGRIDDVLNVSGHRLGTMEIESALVSNAIVTEAAVVGRPCELKGESIVAFVVLKGDRPSKQNYSSIVNELRNWVAKEIGPIAKPEEIRFGDNLPKTRSGKIMRRLLRNIAKGEKISADISTLENPKILEQLSEKL